MTALIVVKFGGTSLKNAQRIQKCAEIVTAHPSRKMVVVSATSGTTNTLVKLGKLLGPDYLEERDKLLDELFQKHLAIAKELQMDESSEQIIKDIVLEAQVLCSHLEKNLHGHQKTFLHLMDRLLSAGERLSSFLFTGALIKNGYQAKNFDVKTILKTDSTFGKAQVQIEQTAQSAQKYLIPLLSEYQAIVTQGFLGSNSLGQTTTLGRGGGDYSAALVAEAIRADSLEIWTDVEGIFTTDPRICSDAKPIKELSFAEASELANFGAKVLHPSTLRPAIRNNINVYVGSSYQPEKKGTWIVQESQSKPIVRALAIRRSQMLVTVTSLKMVGAYGFLARLFTILAKYQISVDLVTTSEVSVALTIDGTATGSSGEQLFNQDVIDELSEFCQVKVEKDLTLVAVIGNNMHSAYGLNTVTFSKLPQFHIRLVCQGASTHNLCFMVEEKDAEEVIKQLHGQFLGQDSYIDDPQDSIRLRDFSLSSENEVPL